MRNHWDIFCRVVDNFGDVGVCWRLARQLVNEHDLLVRIWVDDLDSLALLCPCVDPLQSQQRCQGVEICRWLNPFPQTEVADVVIEAFACELPEGYLYAMSRQTPSPVWINLEYLSAEPWVDGCHQLSSPHPCLPLTKYFFFPGFSPSTGGLIREQGLLQTRAALHPGSIETDLLEISLFCYGNTPFLSLIEAWAQGPQAILCHLAPGVAEKSLRQRFAHKGPWQWGNVQLNPLPFLPQEDYDHLLWRCAINFVRGEDSFVHAQWAGAPFVWNIYPQENEAHRSKLDAFLHRYLQGLPDSPANAVRRFFYTWNGLHEETSDIAACWSDFLAAHRGALSGYGQKWLDRLPSDDLAANLVKFCVVRL